MGQYRLGFCEEMGYPDQVKSHLTQIVDQVLQQLGARNVRCVALFGSTARGELSFRQESHGIDLFSDYELLIVTRRSARADSVAALQSVFDGNRARWEIASPLFHIEFSVNPMWKYVVKGPLLHNIANYELIANGVVMYGDDVLSDQWSRVSVSNLDLGSTNDLIIERLWKQLDLLSGLGPELSLDGYQGDLVKYFTLRNALEISTVFLPNEGVLLPSYRQRTDYLRRRYGDSPVFEDGFAEFMQEAVEGKLTLAFSKPVHYYYERMLAGFLSLTSYLLSGGDSRAVGLQDVDAVCNRLVSSGGRLFNEAPYWRWRRRRREFRSARHAGVARAAQWTLREKRPQILALLFYIHTWLLSVIKGIERPREGWEQARLLLTEIEPGRSKAPGDWWSLVAATVSLLTSLRGSLSGLSCGTPVASPAAPRRSG